MNSGAQMKNIVVIVNPHAKQNKRDPGRASRFSSIIGRRGEVFETLHLEELKDLCRSLPERNVSVVAVCGGDGTNHVVLSTLIETYLGRGKKLPKMLFLQGGSMNTVCRNLEIKRKAEDSLKLLTARMDLHLPLATFKQETINVNGRFGFMFAAGYGYNFLSEYYRSKISPGPRRATKVVFQAIGSTAVGGAMARRLGQKFLADIYIDREKVDFTTFGMVLAGTLPQIGVGFRPLYRAREKEGYFHIVATGFSPFQILSQLNKFFKGGRMVGDNHVDELAMEVRISGKESIGYTVDGEMYENEKEIFITRGPVIEAVLQR